MKPEGSEQNLAKRCSQRDKAAEEQLYRTYAARVYSLCRRYLGNEEDAKDLMLETLVQALDKIGAYKYTGEGSLYAWISRIAINKSINQIKRHRWRFVPLDHEAQDRLPEPTEEEWIAELPDMRRAVFNLYCLDGYSHQAIGRMLGISERSSTSTMAKARKQLKEKIKQYLKEQEP